MTHPLLKTTLVCLMLGLTLRLPARAEGTPGADFRLGNTRYAAGDFAGAVAAYEAEVRRGDDTANLFYNLADAYYRLGDRGRAVLNYQRALILDPAHAEAAANLAFVRGGNQPPTPARAGWVAEGLPWMTAAAGWLAAAGLVTGLAGRRLRAAGWALGVGGLLACVAGAVAIRSLDGGAENAGRAVVVADSVPALYAPEDNSKVITRLTAGGEVRVLSDQGAWVYALLGDGTRAWLASDKIERVVPR